MKLTLPAIVLLVVMVTSPLAAGLKASGSKIIDSSGNEVTLKGFNWFGFNNGQTMVDGLWSNNALSGDFATVVRRQKLLGFNAVRLPFSFKDFDLTPRDFERQNCIIPTDKVLAESVAPLGTKNLGSPPTLENPPPKSAYAGNTCNGYLPKDSVRDRFMYVVEFYAKNGFYVMIDNHLREDQTALEDADAWASKYADLIKDLTADKEVESKLIVDILNEPDNYGVSWDEMTDLYLLAMDQIEATGANVMYAVEGTQQGLLFANWGDGFATERIEELGLGDPRPFFNKLMTKPYENRVMLSPHVYPSSVTFNTNNATGDGLFYRLSTSFGTKTQEPGYCNSNGDCIIFPIAIGEFGSKFEMEDDITFMNDFADYLNNEGPAKDGRHVAIPNWFYWSWNANSGDTGGLVTDNWIDLEWRKMQYLENNLGLEPWYTRSDDKASPVPEPLPVPPPTVPSPPPPPPPTVPSPPPPPPPTVPSPVPPLPPTDPSAACSVRIEKSGIWPTATASARVYNVFVKNTGSDTIKSGWDLEISGDPITAILSAWNWEPSLTNTGTIRGQGTESWLSIAPGSEVNIGLIIEGLNLSNTSPNAVTLNGQACALEQGRIGY